MLGAAVAPLLSFRLYPSETGKTIYVNFSYSGASASAVEMDATAPIEGVLSTIEGIKDISSISGDGWGYITLEFEKNAKAEKVRFRVLSAIREIYPQLPQDVTYPTISSFSNQQQNMVRLLVYTISSNIDPPALKELTSENLIVPLSQIDGVSSVDLFGANCNDWYMMYNTTLMQTLGVTTSQVLQAISRHGYYAEAGVSRSNAGVAPVVLTGKGLNSKDWENIEVACINGRIIRLGQIAKVELRERDANRYYRINGQTAINLVVQSGKDANQIATANQIYARLNELRKNLPASVKIDKTYDSTVQLRNDLSKNVIRTAFSVVILLVFVLVATRSFRYLLVVTLSLVANLSIAMLMYHALKLEIHLYSLSGITLSLGLIIDNTLVMVDHIRHRHNIKVFTALLAATLTTIGALASIFFLDPEQQRNLTDFAWVIIVNLAVSLLVALLLIPALVQKVNLRSMSKKNGVNELRIKCRLSAWYSKCTGLLTRFRGVVLTLGVLMVGLPVFLLPDKIENNDGFWVRAYNSTFGSSHYQSRLKPYIDVALGGTLRLFYNSVWEKSSWGVPERTRLFVRYSMPQGSTLALADGIGRLYEGHILSNPEVERTITNVSEDGGSIEIFFCPELENGTFPFLLKGRLEALANTQAAADFNIYGVGLGFSNSTSFSWANSQILLTGYSHKQLMSWARIFADSLRLMPRVDKIWIKGGRSWNFADEFRRYLDLNQEALLLGGSSVLDFSNELGKNAPLMDHTSWQTVNNRVMLVRLRPQGNIITDFDLNATPFYAADRFFRANQVGTFRNELVQDEIYKTNQQYIITLAYNFIGPDKLMDKVLEEQVEKINRSLPVGFKADFAGGYRWGEKSYKHYLLIALMVLIIYTITSVLFESLLKPLAVIVLIPLSFVGVFITYWLFDLSFDQGTFAAFLLLGGLVVNSAIYIINEQANLMRKYPNLSALNAYKRAVNAKIIPVVLTVVSTVLGLLPFVVYGEEPFWFSLAAGTIGGLIFSIPALLIFLPTLPSIVREQKR